MEKEFDIEFDWRGFELHPETPKGGTESKRPPTEDMSIGGYIGQFAAKFGVEGMKRSRRHPNTRRALGVAEYARDMDKLDEFRELAMDAHWINDKNIEDDAVLAELAKAAGLDPEKALKAADDPEIQERLDNQRIEYKQVGVSGIPTFVFGSTIKVEGCQPYEVLADAAVRAGAKRK